MLYWREAGAFEQTIHSCQDIVVSPINFVNT